MKFTSKDVKTIDNVQKWRRDVRHFRNVSVNEVDVNAVIAAMDNAPSVGNARPWRVLRVKSPELRKLVRDEFENCNFRAAEKYKDERLAKYTDLKLAGLDAAPEQFAIFTDMSSVAGHGLGRQTMPQTLEHSTSMAIYCLWQMARVRNIGLGMVSILEPERIEEIFEVESSWKFAAYLCLGYPEFNDDTPLLHTNDWQLNSKTECTIV